MTLWNSQVRAMWAWTSRLLSTVFGILLVLVSSLIISRATAQTDLLSRLAPEEQDMARNAWAYFASNINQTGFANSVSGYPSGTLWEQGNLAVALIAVRQFGIISEDEFSARMNQFLETLSSIPLFEESLPNKAYSTETGAMTDYGNNPIERGIGFSALDLGRLFNALYVVKTHAPEYGDWIDGILSGWALDRMYMDSDLFGAVVLPDDSTLAVQEGRHGYGEYAARSGSLLERDVTQALNPPVAEVDIYGVKIKNDTRHFEDLNAIAYTVTEAPVLEIIEHGVAGRPEVWDEYCTIYAAQKRRWEETDILTAVTEDHITFRLFPDTPFLYSTVVGDGVPWAVVTEQNERFDERRTLSTKAAVLLRTLQPQDDPDAYGQRVFDAVLSLFNEAGYFAGRFEETGEPNDVLTNNTNAIVLEALLAIARGESLITQEPFPTTCGSSFFNASSDQSNQGVISPEPDPQPEVQPSSPTIESTESSSAPTTDIETPRSNAIRRKEGELIGVLPSERPGPGVVPCQVIQTSPQGPLDFAAIPSLGEPQPSLCSKGNLSAVEQRYARAAWQYFRVNTDPTTGLVSSRERFGATTIWGIGDSIAAINIAHTLGLIDNVEFDQRIRHLLGTLQVLPLVEGLPHIAYSTINGAPVDLGGNPQLPEEWDASGILRVMVALAELDQCHPEFQDAIARILLNWRYYALFHDGLLYSGKLGTSPILECSLYAAYDTAGLRLWGLEAQDVSWKRVILTDDYQSPVGCDDILVSSPLLYMGLELGFTQKWQQVAQDLWLAQQTQPIVNGLATVGLDRPPYVLHNAAWAGKPWISVGIDGEQYPDLSVVSTGAAFAWAALFPDDSNAQELQASVTDLSSELLGYVEGYYTNNGEPVGVRTARGNFLVLASLCYRQGGPLIQDFQPASLWVDRGWWIGG